MSKHRSISHGIPRHDYFGIIQPIFQLGGLDCRSVSDGVGLDYTLTSPLDNTSTDATLICRRMIYTDSDAFDAIAYLTYGISGSCLLSHLKQRYEDMQADAVELWCFKKV